MTDTTTPLIAGQTRIDGTEVTPAEAARAAGASHVTITVEFSADLGELECWPDRDAPQVWNAHDVAALIAKDCATARDLLHDYSLDTFATVEIADNVGNRVTVDYPGARVSS